MSLSENNTQINQLYAFYRDLVLDASKTIFFIAKIHQLYVFYQELVLDASKTIFSAKLTLHYCDEREIQSSERSIHERIV